MIMTILYHNPRCSKSRQTLELLQNKGVQFQTIDYLKETPSVEEIKKIKTYLGDQADQIIRKKESLYTEMDLDKKDLSCDELASVLHNNPQLLERPILIHNNKAAIGRPPEKVLEIL